MTLEHLFNSKAAENQEFSYTSKIKQFKRFGIPGLIQVCVLRKKPSVYLGLYLFVLAAAKAVYNR